MFSVFLKQCQEEKVSHPPATGAQEHWLAYFGGELVRWLDESYIDVVGPQRVDSRAWQVTIGDEVMNRAGRRDP